ncbi:hypothetical protein [Streptomyces sp. NPDC048603]|uniref:hypothetical protein n=1 Tax=Streptomyces sp. NPDC048603 TaxID=3365577 RepID=UPI00371F33BE
MPEIFKDKQGQEATVTRRSGDVVLTAQGSLLLAPEDARLLANALTREADKAESGTSEVARLRHELDEINKALREAGIDYPLGVRGVRDLAALFEHARDGED